MTITLNMACNTFICIILFGLAESSKSKITLFKDLIGKKIEFFSLFRDFKFNYISRIKSLNKVILDDSDRTIKAELRFTPGYNQGITVSFFETFLFSCSAQWI